MWPGPEAAGSVCSGISICASRSRMGLAERRGEVVECPRGLGAAVLSSYITGQGVFSKLQVAKPPSHQPFIGVRPLRAVGSRRATEGPVNVQATAW